MEHRERVIPFADSTHGRVTTVIKNYQTDPVTATVDVMESENQEVIYHLQGYQITDTETHPEFRLLRKGVYLGDVGGPFFTQKWHTRAKRLRGDISGSRVVDYVPDIWPNGKQSHRSHYEGPILPLPPHQLEWPTLSPSSSDELAEFGTTAISRCSPSNPTTDLTTTIGEFFNEGIPKVVGGTLAAWRSLSSQKRRQAIGDEYLNIEFGWKPFVSSLREAAEALLSSGKVWKNYVDNSGKLVRRRYEFPEEIETTITLADSHASPWHAPSTSVLLEIPIPQDLGVVYRTDKVTTRRWFSGAFSYYVPPISNDLTDQAARAFIMARKTLGLSLTPDSVWNLAPWSWAVDWFSNTGDMLSNWTDWAIDNQVLMYGYIMEHKVHERTYTFAGNTGLQSGSPPMDITKVVETKVRLPATPYGFGLTYDGLSDRQKTIIAALGISRSK